jgi:hypothetical protein
MVLLVVSVGAAVIAVAPLNMLDVLVAFDRFRFGKDVDIDAFINMLSKSRPFDVSSEPYEDALVSLYIRLNAVPEVVTIAGKLAIVFIPSNKLAHETTNGAFIVPIDVRLEHWLNIPVNLVTTGKSIAGIDVSP